MNPQLRRSVVDFGPLLVFFLAYKMAGLYAATAAVMVAAIAAAGIGYWLDRKLHPVPMVTAVIVVLFGGLTLYLNDATFIKMKPTMVYGLLGATMLGGLVFRKPFAKYVFGAAITMTDESWRALSWRFALFFFGMAFLNELIWRSFSNDIWVDFHVFGAIALTVLFSLSQVPFLLSRQMEDEVPGSD
jgi:intracellular septation protein